MIFYGYFGRLPYSIYSTNQSPEVVEISSASYNLGGGDRLPEPNIFLISSFEYQRVWLVSNRESGDLFDRGEQFGKVNLALEKSYKLVKEKDFSGVGVKLFERNNLTKERL